MFEKKRGTRFLASVMALVMLLSLAPVGALAYGGPGGGDNPGGDNNGISVNLNETSRGDCNVYYAETKTAYRDISTDQSLTELNQGGSVTHAKSEDLTSYGVIFFVAPHNGYALEGLGATASAEIYQSIVNNENLRQTDFWTKNSQIENLKRAGFTEEQIEALAQEAKNKGCVAAFIFTRSASNRGDIDSNLNFTTHQLATFEKSITAVQSGGTTYTGESVKNVKVRVGDVITYSFEVTFYPDGNNITYSDIVVTDERLGGEDSQIAFADSSSAGTNTQTQTKEYTVKPEDISKDELKNTATLTYNYTAPYNVGAVNATATATATIATVSAVSYRYDNGPRPSDATDITTGDYEPREHSEGESVTVAADPTGTGYTFSGWKTTNTEVTVVDNKFDMPSTPVIFTGSWTAKDNVSYTVHYYKQGTTDKVANDKQVKEQTFNTEVTETAEEVSGYTLVGSNTQTMTLDAYDKEIFFYYEPNAVTYTVIFDANEGKWTDTEAQRQQTYYNNRSDSVTPVADPARQGYDFDGWAYKTSEDKLELITTFAGATVDRMMKLPEATGTSVTLYAVWKDNNTAPTGSLDYRINQYFIDETGGVANSISKPGRNTVGTAISTLISDLVPQDQNFPNYRYEEARTTVNNEKYSGNEKLAQDDTVINLYYYLDSWKDGDTDPDNTTDDSLTGGDDIPDCKQILIQYQVYQEGNGQVSPTFEVVTVNDNGTKTEIKGSTATATPKYVFVTWTKGKVTDKNVGELATTISTEKHCTPVSGELEVGQPYTYTAIFLEDKVGEKDKDGNDKGDGIPDAWQYKVTFKVSNGKWDNGTTADVVAYVTNKKDDIPCAKGTEGSKATLDGVTIPGAGSQPNSGYRASGNWDATLSATTVITKENTVFTYNYDQKSGGSGGSGGSSRPSTPPTVDIPDDVPTGLNGKDHYAYIIGYGNNDVRPQNNITRAEVATIFFRLLTDETREANMTKSNSYNDVKDGDWFCCAVSTLSKMGIIKGYEDGSFKPNAPISRAEFAAIAARFDPDGDKTPATFADVTSHWAKDEISIAANHGWIKGYEDGSFKPDQKITRAETMTLVNRVLNRLPETKDDLHKDMKTWVDNMDETAWYYLAVQEATNSHYFKNKTSTKFEQWTDLRDTRDWSELEK